MLLQHLGGTDRSVAIRVAKQDAGVAEVVAEVVFKPPGATIRYCPPFGMVDRRDLTILVFNAIKIINTADLGAFLVDAGGDVGGAGWQAGAGCGGAVILGYKS